MPNYLRNEVYGGTYFFTLVTNDRKPFFSNDKAAEILLNSIRKVQRKNPFELVAYCILFDHLHLLITLPSGDKSFSQKIRGIKRYTTLALRQLLNVHDLIVWQDRFWEHTIRNESDFKNHFDYIHYNPTKHGYVEDYADWVWSSYRWYDQADAALGRIDPESLKINRFGYGE